MKGFQAGILLLDYQLYSESNSRVRNEAEFTAGNCPLRTFVSFVANRDIIANEPLTVRLYVDPASSRRFASKEFTKYCF